MREKKGAIGRLSHLSIFSPTVEIRTSVEADVSQQARTAYSARIDAQMAEGRKLVAPGELAPGTSAALSTSLAIDHLASCLLTGAADRWVTQERRTSLPATWSRGPKISTQLNRDRGHDDGEMRGRSDVDWTAAKNATGDACGAV